MNNAKNLLIIFTRNPELGKCKTRLAQTIGDKAALDIYKFLLNHTVKTTYHLAADKQVHYSVKIRDKDYWDSSIYQKKQQYGDDLGQRMENAFANAFKEGYKRVIIIGSDMYDLNQNDLELAFEALKNNEYVIGPAQDGGYYLLGMTSLNATLFRDKNWGTDTVLSDTLKNLAGKQVKLLDTRNDIDYYEDIEGIEAFSPFLPKTIKK